jgi:septal ring factor EnvC (AmiA/AmiB activator)
VKYPKIYKFSFNFLLLLLGIFSSLSLPAQKLNKAQLEQQKRINLRKIAETHKILQETTTEKKATLGKLTALSEQISTRKKLIHSMETEVEILDKELIEIDGLTEAMETDLKALKKEYAALIYATAKANNGYNKLAFLFSADSFNQLFQRIIYLRQYTKARQTQKEQIDKVKKRLDSQRRKRNEKRYERQLLLQAQGIESKNLTNLQDQHQETVKQLSAREQDLKDELDKEQRELQQVENLIADLIEKEIKRSREEAEKSVALRKDKTEKVEKKTDNTIKLTAEEAVTAASFSDLKNKMTWPVKSGFVSSHFGKHPHPELKGIEEKNDGITIQTNRGAEVRVVYEGIVKAVMSPSNYKFVVVQHGDYFTVYNKLTNVTVKSGQKLKANDLIGTASTNSDGETEIQFQIWKNAEKLDPENWLSER